MFKTVMFSIVMVIAVIYGLGNSNDVKTLAAYLFSPSRPVDKTFEEQLIAGADPTELLEATASAGKPEIEVDCQRVSFGKAGKHVFVKEAVGNIYVADVGGLKSFQLKSTYVAREVPFDERAELLRQAYKYCERPELLYSAGISLVTRNF